ncbi:uncharacterized protein PAC_06610 [Phialocephala subalpina]|uniref:Extracellular membrane protein CFEM domain-containing protein n=1 Tax=Phialocephala subalpina TaxID=576137 RepID=A0A1L7WVD0_9HELO|nr:uncharacterized protein PAC_06610 [Phialocephala subalpina]
MHPLTLVNFLFACLAVATAATITSVTPAPAPTSHHKDLLRARLLLARSKRDDIDNLDFCYGDHSICEENNNLHGACEAFETQDDQTQFYECLCGNGYVSVNQALVMSIFLEVFPSLTQSSCGWCDDVFGLSGDMDSFYFDQCSSYSFTVAPIPSSVLALESSYNATYTGTMPVGVTLTQGSGGSSQATTTGTGTSRVSKTSAGGSGFPLQTGSSTSSKKSTSTPASSTITLGGGTLSTPTAQGSTSQNLVATQTITRAPGTGSAAGLKCLDALLMSGVVFAISMVFALL